MMLKNSPYPSRASRPGAPRLLSWTLEASAWLGLLALSGCSPDASATSTRPVQVATGDQTQAERDILDLILAVTPAPATLPPVEKNAWLGRNQEIRRRLRAGGPEVGREALRMYHVKEDDLPEIRAGLLDVAAHAAPEETLPVLVDLVSNYGDELYLRTQAALFLGRTSPAKALEVLGPILQGDVRGTFPPEDKLLDSWNTAAVALGHERTPLLCDIATDLKRDQVVRHHATELLGELPGPQSRQALELLLTESSGNQYIRRKAAQSLRNSLPAAELCPLLDRVIERESDVNFQIFLDNMRQQNCS